jgi:hydroxymethylpyrimidine pyrophosphatase-like HAD family hydrolase
MHKGVNKSNSLKILCERLAIAPEELIACGDGDNDEPMLRYAGLGCAMSNATEKTKNAANYICKNANGHGVLEVVNKFLKSR